MKARVLALLLVSVSVCMVSTGEAKGYGSFRFGIGLNFGFDHGSSNYGYGYGPTYNIYNYYSPYAYVPYYYVPRVVYTPPPVVVVPSPTYVAPAISYVQPAIYVVPAPTYVQPATTYVQPATTHVQPAPSHVQPQTFSLPIPAVSNQPATIIVRLADPNCQVYFDETLTQQSGTERRFHTPPLAFVANNSYTIRAVSPQSGVAQAQRVRVTPGQSVVVDFTRANSEGVPAPR